LKIDYDSGASSATVHFETPNAAHTALMLNGGTLDGSHLTVTSDAEPSEAHEDTETPHPDGAPFHQSDKPRAAIAAEYLARGYTLSDHILQRAIDIDNQKGISKRFLSYLSSLDSTLGAKALGPDQTISSKVQTTLNTATDKAREVDEQRGFSKIAGDYYAKAISSPLGQKFLSFYTTTSKQVVDIHEEARRIADQRKPAAPGVPVHVDEAAGPVETPVTAN